jgi:hypothetical protein
MTRVSFITTALVIGLLAGSAASAQAKGKDKKDNKDKGHKFIGLSPVDFPHHDDKHHGDKHHDDKHHGDKDCKNHDGCDKDRCDGKDNCGKDNCKDGSCHHGTKPPKENMGGSTNHPPGTPGGPPLPKKPWPIKLPPGATKFYGSQTLAGNPMKGLHDPLRPSPNGGRPAPSQGQIPTLGTGFNGFAGAIGKDVGSAVGFGVTAGLKGVGAVANAVGDVAGGVANAVGDVAGGIVSGLESLL